MTHTTTTTTATTMRMDKSYSAPPTYYIFSVCLSLLLFHTTGISAQAVLWVEVGQNISISCLSSESNVTWKYNNATVSVTDKRIKIGNTVAGDLSAGSSSNDELDSQNIIVPNLTNYTLTLTNVTLDDGGMYACESANANETRRQQLQPFMAARVVASNEARVKQKIGHSVMLFCLVQAYPQNITTLKWLKDNTAFAFLDKSTSVARVNATHFNYTLELAEVYKKENGTYACVLYEANHNSDNNNSSSNNNNSSSTNSKEVTRQEIALLVMDVPQVSIDYVKVVGATKIYLNWTVNDGNDPVQKYFVQVLEEGAPTFKYYGHVIGGKNTSYVLENFKPNTTYYLRLSAKNSIGEGTHFQYQFSVRTLGKDPVFIPKVETTGSTSSTITIGWDPPPLELLDYIHYYELVCDEAEPRRQVEEAFYHQNSRNLPYMFDNLKTATDYEFKVRACDITKICGPWSDIVNGTTMDGVASKPTSLHVDCVSNNHSRKGSVSIQWNTPAEPNGKVVSYQINLRGMYTLNGKTINDTSGSKIRRIDEPQHKTEFHGVNPNTNYTVTVSAITRHKKIGQQALGVCTMPVSVPDSVSRVTWTKVKTPDEKCVFKLYIPEISERNGPICCYRLYLLRMRNWSMEPPPPDKLNVQTYAEVHAANNTFGGAYIAEMFSASQFRSEIFLGDGKRFLDNEQALKSVDMSCRACLRGQSFLRKDIPSIADNLLPPPPAKPQDPLDLGKVPILPEQSQREQLNKAGNLTEAAFKILDSKGRNRRNPKLVTRSVAGTAEDAQSVGESRNETYSSSTGGAAIADAEVFDGEIDMHSNYTGFLEVLVRDGDTVLTAYSNYFDVITPGTMAEQFYVEDMPTILNIFVPIAVILLGVVVIMASLLCLLHFYSAKHNAQGEEVISLRDSLRALFGGHSNNHRRFIGGQSSKADIGPIQKADLYMAYKNRHKDTDYGFLREYEMLPNRFSDRTTKNSDAKENACKNRYPDIKAYDQTRVKLSQLNGVQYSDYINANFVIGYKERKKFICAQGPMESTINDFWRMIWEQHLEIIVMLTNLEEYNKSKCAKYWPEKVADFRKFGDITVKFVAEKKLGDYLVRSLDVSKRMTETDGEEERRQITQYHYLVWKDFMAPEHPHGIIKFIRHINAVYSVQRGPILVHCSAGVGRTGTLVALDSLLQQLDEEEQVSTFNTVCDLRHQRNFLVQSLKQYIFLYRALLDTANFGDTEINAFSLTATIDTLKSKPTDGKEGKCKLEIEFEKLLAITDENNKAATVGNLEENTKKNRSNSVVPYDRNRVILTPIPLKDNSTYINATFIEGYVSSESFIITQDPMENTINDFWRMISEQSISTLVMISEIGDGPRKCPRYWADDEIQYDHILVKYIHSESCPYYTRREFHVTNCKIDDTIEVTQFQYNGWPTVDGEVPEVCRGIMELVDQAQNHHGKEKNSGCRSPLTVHCGLGTDRSSIFVAMCILVQQLRTEKGVDICSITRKLRSQRPQLINSYAQYEFLHRAIANYADLHKLSAAVESPEC